MNSLKIYLCGPINGCTDEEANGWRQIATDHLLYLKGNPFGQNRENPNMVPVDPMDRDYRGMEAGVYREIVDLDKLDIRNSDALLVYYEKPSVGTSMEVFYAWTLGKPIIVLTPRKTKISPWLRYHSTKIVEYYAGELREAINEAVEWMRTI